jgi:hypothetical protein
MVGSLMFKLMRMLERRRLLRGLRCDPLDERRDSALCSPALRAAAAASECVAVVEGE